MENLSVLFHVLFHETDDFLNDNKLTNVSNGEKLIDETLNAKGSRDDNIIDCTEKVKLFTEDTLDVISRPIWENMAESPVIDYVSTNTNRSSNNLELSNHSCENRDEPHDGITFEVKKMNEKHTFPIAKNHLNDISKNLGEYEVCRCSNNQAEIGAI
ncbi:hypothetical protein L1887_01641 [Cichorium endivia]|nr:hypothetical protein L1887_01641 [Cichorium endivia]